MKSAWSLAALAALATTTLVAHAETVVLGRAGVKLDSPSGWNKSSAAGSDWVIYKPADQFARLGWVVFDKPGESTKRIGQISTYFDVTGVTWGGPKDGNVGAFPAHSATSTSCTLKNGDSCLLWYATVNPGGAEQILIVYLINSSKGTSHNAAVKASVQSLRKG